MPHPINRDLNRLANLKRVKQQLFNHAAISRADISRNTGLTRSTVSSLFVELDKQEYIKHLGRGDSTESGGRKPELYTVNTHYGYIACFNLTYDSLYVMFLYIDGQEISFQRFSLADHELLKVMNIINQQIDSIAKHNDTEHGLLGISFSIHAVVKNNQIVHSPYYPIHKINLQQYFMDRYHVPVQIGNEANLAAIYERDYVDQTNPANFIVLSIHKGPGIGVIANHQLFTGFHGLVGEIGSVQVPNRHGNFQELGDLFSSDYLLEQISQASAQPIHDLHEAHQIVQKGLTPVNEILQDFAQITGHLLYDLQMLYGPEKILINSPLIEALPELSTLIKKAAIDNGIVIPIMIISGAKYVSLLGAGALMIRQVLDLSNVNLKFQWSRHIG